MLTIFLFVSINLTAGYIDYYNAVNEGEYHMYEGQYDLAIANFSEAFSLVEFPNARDYYLVSKCYSQLNVEPEMLLHLELAIKGGLNKSYIEADSLWFTNFRFSDSFKTLLKIKPEKNDIQEDKKSKLAFKSLKKGLNRTRTIQYYRLYEKRDSLADQYDSFLKKYLPYCDSMTASLTDYLFNHSLPTDTKDMNTLIVLCQLFLYSELPEIDSIESILLGHLDNGVLTPIEFGKIFEWMPLKRPDPERQSNYIYGLSMNTVQAKDLKRIIEKRQQIGLSRYFFLGPNYQSNYKPQPIELIIKSTVPSQSSN